MNLTHARQLVRPVQSLAAALGLLVGAAGARGADSPPARFLLIFETSPVLKKNLPSIHQDLARLFSSNLQNELRADDDLAVWTVDESLHPGEFPLTSWAPEDAEGYARRLDDFLRHQKFRRHASLAPIQPLLNRVVKESERLTVIIFCDSQSRLQGTPYDDGVNDIMANAAARGKSGAEPFILVLRSYKGEYLGGSVNRAAILNFPKFPPPPQPVPPPVAAKPPLATPPVSGPPVAPVPALIIVGTNATTNAAAATKPAAPVSVVSRPAAPAPLIITNAPLTNTTVSTPSAPPPVSLTVTAQPPVTVAKIVPAPPVQVPTVQLPPSNPPPSNPPPSNPPPSNPPPSSPPPSSPPPSNPPPSNPPPSSPPPGISPPIQPAPTVAVRAVSNLPPTISTTAVPGPVPPPPATEARPPASTAAQNPPADRGYLWPLALGGGALAAAAGLGTWLVARARRPRGSLITSSMQDELHTPPRK